MSCSPRNIEAGVARHQEEEEEEEQERPDALGCMDRSEDGADEEYTASSSESGSSSSSSGDSSEEEEEDGEFEPIGAHMSVSVSLNFSSPRCLQPFLSAVASPCSCFLLQL
eukprot:597634-Pelagomonas_calceolata.AAC.1